LSIDLTKVLDKPTKNGKKFENSNQIEIDPVMRYLGIDITFEDSPVQ
jgi:hypothetical protein